ncbi:MAG: hypothetical protein JWM02_3065 [Frankiales bacterium]|nr:hypothetical protein [Frankiales bacterium]
MDLVDLVPPDGRLVGRWQRSLLATARGHRDTTTDVSWLQGRTLYVDLRTPVPAADLSAVRCLRDLSTDQAVALAADGPWARWVRWSTSSHPPGLSTRSRPGLMPLQRRPQVQRLSHARRPAPDAS